MPYWAFAIPMMLLPGCAAQPAVSGSPARPPCRRPPRRTCQLRQQRRRRPPPRRATAQQARRAWPQQPAHRRFSPPGIRQQACRPRARPPPARRFHPPSVRSSVYLVSCGTTVWAPAIVRPSLAPMVVSVLVLPFTLPCVPAAVARSTRTCIPAICRLAYCGVAARLRHRLPSRWHRPVRPLRRHRAPVGVLVFPI